MRDVLRRGGGAFLAKVCGAGMLFLFHALVARRHGPAGAGVFAIVLTTQTLVGLVARRGLDNAVVRFVAAARAAGDWAEVRGVHEVALRQSLVAAIVLAVVLWSLSGWLARDVFDILAVERSLQWMAVGIVPLTLSRVHGEALRGFGWVVTSQVLQLACVPTIAFGVLLCFDAGSIHAPAWSYVAGLAVAAGIGVVAWRVASPQIRGVRGTCDVERLRASSRPLLWASLWPIALPAVGTYLLGVVAERREVGIYQMAFTTAGLTSFVLIAFNAILGPTFSKLHGQGDKAALAATARGSVRFMTAAALPPLLVFLAFPGEVLALFGPRFDEGAVALRVLAIGQFLNVATGPVGNLLMMTGHERLVRDHAFAGLLACVLLNLWLTPWLGIDGAAISTAVGLVLQNLLSLVRVRTRLGIRLWW